MRNGTIETMLSEIKLHRDDQKHHWLLQSDETCSFSPLLESHLMTHNSYLLLPYDRNKKK